MQILQSRSFRKKVRKFPKREKRILDRQIRKIFEDPAIGEEKKGDLNGILFHK
ncbi:MAG: type II toxin-antitoxin system RelE/ParE family toxin, partial [PVC group bacterium]